MLTASYFSFTEGGGPIKQHLAYLWYIGLHVDVTCVGYVNDMGRVRKGGSNVMFVCLFVCLFVFRNKGPTR